MRSSCPLLGAMALLVMVLGSVAGPAQAQQASISQGTIEAESLSAQQEQEIRDYVQAYAEVLSNGNTEEVAQARLLLVEPLEQGGASEAFQADYSQAVSDAFSQVMQSDRQIVRLNAMIVATRMAGYVPMDLLAAGLEDPSPGVRYWAAKAVGNLAEQAIMPPEEQRELLEPLMSRLESENIPHVLEQVMGAIAQMEVPDAGEQLLARINSRVEQHLDQPGQSLNAEHMGMRRLYRQMASQGNPDQELMHELARTAVRYMDLTAAMLEQTDLEDQRLIEYTELLNLTGIILEFVHGELNVAGLQPPGIENAVAAGQWSSIRSTADDWREVLQGQPFNFDNSELVLN